MKSTPFRISGAFIITAAMVFQMACSKSQLIASAEDVLAVVTNQQLNNALAQLSPSALAKLVSLVPKARQLVEAVKTGDTSSAAGLVNTIFPIIQDIAAQLGASQQILAVIAIADIALHFLLNHLTKETAKMAKSKGAAPAMISELESLKNQRAWGCDYLPKDRRCLALAH